MRRKLAGKLRFLFSDVHYNLVLEKGILPDCRGGLAGFSRQAMALVFPVQTGKAASRPHIKYS